MPAPTDLTNLLELLLGEGAQDYLRRRGERSPTTFRFNSLKHTRHFQESLLASEGFEYAPLEDQPDLLLATREPRSIGKSLAHFLGDIYIQDTASMLAARALAPTAQDRVLDLCAAPGSKTTLLAELMENRGILLANDSSMKRIRSLAFNLRRMGVTNTAVIKAFGEQLGNLYFESFDKVLLDAPCSALGTIHKSPEVLSWWTPRRSMHLAKEQSGLLYSAIKALRPGGAVVYSTCTIAPQENEAVLDQALKQYPVELEPLEIRGLVTRPGLTEYDGVRFDSQLERAVRIYPHENPCEGFFIARLRKTASFGERRLRRPLQAVGLFPDRRRTRPLLRHLATYFGIPPSRFETWSYLLSAELSCCNRDFEDFPFYVKPVRLGLPIAHIKSSPARMTTAGSHLLGVYATRHVFDLPDVDALFNFVNRTKLPADREKEDQVVVRYSGQPVGHGIIGHGHVISRFPRIGWRFGEYLQESPPRG
jgi:NOL1/NOP2/sun family putative RNA methylase